MKTIYLYLLDTMAEWEIGNVLQAVSMEEAIRKEQPKYQVKTFALTKDPVRTIGGLTITPDLLFDEVKDDDMVAFLLPGAETWSDPKHARVIDKALDVLKKDVVVGAICGATLALAERGLLDHYEHSSNSVEYLTYFSTNYKGQSKHVNQLATADRNLITASVAGSLEWARLIIHSLKVYPEDKVDLWYQFFSTGKSEYYMRLVS